MQKLTKQQAIEQITPEFQRIAGAYIERMTCLYVVDAVPIMKGLLETLPDCATHEKPTLAEFVKHVQPWVNKKEKQVMNEMDPSDWHKKQERGKKELRGL